MAENIRLENDDFNFYNTKPLEVYSIEIAWNFCVHRSQKKSTSAGFEPEEVKTRNTIGQTCSPLYVVYKGVCVNFFVKLPAHTHLNARRKTSYSQPADHKQPWVTHWGWRNLPIFAENSNERGSLVLFFYINPVRTSCLRKQTVSVEIAKVCQPPKGKFWSKGQRDRAGCAALEGGEVSCHCLAIETVIESIAVRAGNAPLSC